MPAEKRKRDDEPDEVVAKRTALQAKIARVRTKPDPTKDYAWQHATRQGKTPSRQGTPASTNRRSHSRSVTPAVQPQKPKPAQLQCPDCQSTDTIKDDGNTVCANCGVMIAESQIAAEPIFQEGSNGAAQLVGSHVGADQSGPRPMAGVGRLFNEQNSTDSTRAAARNGINGIASIMGISNSDVDRAVNVYNMAHTQGLTKGRDGRQVLAACLFIGCKKDSQNRYLLIDFAEAVEANVYQLGRIYQAIYRANFWDKLEQGQPAEHLYSVNIENLIHRYVSDLDFGNDGHRVAAEAIRIFKRMDRDWIVTGRRPSGLCGAAIILAARMNNYRRTVREVVYTVKVCEATVNERLKDFGYTAAAKLTVKEFREHASTLRTPDYYQPTGEDDGDGVAVCAPPAFYRQFMPRKVKKSHKRKRSSDDDDDEETSGDEIDEESTIADASALIDGLDSIIADVAAVPSKAAPSEADPSEASKPPPRKRTRSGDETAEGKQSKKATAKKVTAKQSAQARRKAKDDRVAMPPPPIPQPQSLIDPALLAASNEAWSGISVQESASAPTTAPVATIPQRRTRKTPSKSPSPDRDGQVPKQASPNSRKPKTVLELTEEGAKELEDLEGEIEAAAANPEHVSLAESAHTEYDKNPFPAATDNKAGNDALQVAELEEPEEEDPDPLIPNHQDLVTPMVEDANGNLVPKKYYPTTAQLTSLHPDTPVIPEDEFADDPEVDDCFLDPDERKLKEGIWVTKYGAYLEAQHLKKMARIIDEQNGIIKKRRGARKPPLGDVSGYEQLPDGKVAEDLPDAYMKLWAHRGEKGMSKKINWDRVREIYGQKLEDRSTSPESQPEKIFDGRMLVKKTKAKNPTTREGREQKKRENAAKREAKKAEKERQQREKSSAARSSVASRSANRSVSAEREESAAIPSPVADPSQDIDDDAVTAAEDVPDVDPDTGKKYTKAEKEAKKAEKEAAALEMWKLENEIGDDDSDRGDEDDWDGEEYD